MSDTYSNFKEQLLRQLSSQLHGHYFPEEYDYVYDSISEARDRRRGINPMSKEYTERVNRRRLQRGVSALNNEGHAQDGTSVAYAHTRAVELLQQAETELDRHLSAALYDIDPARTCCRENECEDEYDAIAAAIIACIRDGESYPVAIRQQMILSFGREHFDHRTLNTLSEAALKLITRSICQVLIQSEDV
ncbi:hypothetical protein [Pseudidiomarina sediminum]|uniref:hypothetical protein n=1 Tax=Pseudidiomarina sediminum TaxID=431675 RepID=UPI001C96D5C0|nr:hypothetical protein [Pseudidiomarina sediminum]MBY6064514.1 hypothetical protein [Pseudidiomarina sediminum]